VRVIAAIVIALACALAVALLLGLLLSPFVAHNGPTGFDAAVLRWFTTRRTPERTHVMRLVTSLGSGVVVIPLTITAASALVLSRRRRLALLVILAVTGAALVNWIAKTVVDRNRPSVAVRLQHPHASSFPSGHSVQAAATFVVLGIVVTSLTRRRVVRAVVWTTVALLVVAVGISRLYLGVHWATDVLAGWLVGTVSAVGVAGALGTTPPHAPRPGRCEGAGT
jgi:undecaprenyl-diphosphatase